MDKKYIDANELIENLEASCMPIHEKGISGCLGDNKSIADVINDQPAEDVQEVRHGKWEQENEIFKCSECAYAFENEGYQHFFNYCPNCGARMDGEENG